MGLAGSNGACLALDSFSRQGLQVGSDHTQSLPSLVCRSVLKRKVHKWQWWALRVGCLLLYEHTQIPCHMALGTLHHLDCSQHTNIYWSVHQIQPLPIRDHLSISLSRWRFCIDTHKALRYSLEKEETLKHCGLNRRNQTTTTTERKSRLVLGLGGKRVQLLQCMISFTTGMSGGIGGGTIPKPGIIGVIGGIPVIIPSAGSKSEKGEKKRQ